MIFGDPGITSAICTQVFTEGEVNIKADSVGLIALIKRKLNRFNPLFLRWRFRIPVWYGWVAGVPGSGNMIFANQIGCIHSKKLNVF